jgi:hypothetical protein
MKHRSSSFKLIASCLLVGATLPGLGHSCPPPQSVPWGYVDTPANGASNLAGAINVAGWALSPNQAATAVRIYRNRLPAEQYYQTILGLQLVYIGDATFVPGSRPDVAACYPTPPYTYGAKAGWGYQILSNALPGTNTPPKMGNGQYTITAIATGGSTTSVLGQRTITVNNDASIKPFGTLDTPASGQTLTGSSSPVSGWALTPQPKMILNNGTSLQLYIDGQLVDYPTYGQSRPDVSGLFPNYANSYAPGGSSLPSKFDPSGYAAGLHTIAWSVWDNYGVGEGLGSRYWIATPTITGFSPTTAAPGTEVTVSGGSFGNQQGVVEVNGAVVIPTQWTMKSIKFLVPPNATQGPITIRVGDYVGTSSQQLVISAPPLVVPTVWKGINYSPRRHSYPRMLYDWYTFDAAAGMLVKDMVAGDLTRLKDNGVNVLHLYLWDRTHLKKYSGGAEPSGFYSCSSDPSTNPTQTPAQWAALHEFLSLAEARNLFVALHFANQCVKDRIKSPGVSTDETIANEYVTWMNYFVSGLSPTHRNILFWGLNWSWDPVPYPEARNDDGNSPEVWGRSYKGLDDAVKNANQTYAMQATVGVGLKMWFMDPAPSCVNPCPPYPQSRSVSTILPRPAGGYAWNYAESQIIAKRMRDELTLRYGFQKDPDYYMPQGYAPNTSDLRAALFALASGPVSGGISVPVSKMFIHEFATSSSAADAPNGTSMLTASMEDSQLPSATLDGQSQWLKNALCAYTGLGINKFAYWAMYDPYELWSQTPWNLTGHGLAWQGFWGLINRAGTDKPSWAALTNYYKSNSLSCPAAPTPVLALKPEGDYYTIAQPLRVTWAAADVTSLRLNSYTDRRSFDCRSLTETLIGSHPTELLGSCAYGIAGPFYDPSTPSGQIITLTGDNGLANSVSVSSAITIGRGPVVSVVLNEVGTPTITTTSTITVHGKGFSKEGGNTFQFVRPGYPDVWMWKLNPGGFDFTETELTQITAPLGNRLAPGSWSLRVRNNYSGDPSVEFPVFVN